MMEKNAKIYVAGHRGMVGSAIVRELERQGAALQKRYPDFDLRRELADPRFAFLTSPQVGMNLEEVFIRIMDKASR